MSLAATERVPATVPTLLRLAWPLIVSRSSQVVVGLCDALMIAHLGQAALAATTAGAMNALALFILPMGTVFIVSSFSSQYFGKGDLEGARRYAVYGLIIAAATAIVSAISIPLLPRVLPLFDFTPEVRALVERYLSVRLLAGGAVVGLEALANYYGGLGNTRLPMVANVVAMGLNVLGNWLLIDGRLGLPALGVAGAAWASVLATAAGFVGLLVHFLVKDSRGGRAWPPLRAEELWRTLRFGLPSGLNWFLEFFAFLFFVNVVMAGLGTTALAGLMAVTQLSSAAFMPAFGLASAGAIVVGQAIGARAREEVPRAVGLTFLLAAGWQVALGALYFVAPELVFGPFARGEGAEALLALGTRLLKLSVVWQLCDAGATTLAEALRAAGDTAFTLWARLVVAWAVFVPGSWLTVRRFGGGEVGGMLWLAVYLGLLALVLFLRFRGGAWRRFDLAD